MASSKARRRQNSSSSEDDAYILLHPSGASAGTIGYTGDSGFEDVQPLQRLDQEVENDLSKPESKYCYYFFIYRLSVSDSLDRDLIVLYTYRQFSIIIIIIRLLPAQSKVVCI